MKFSPPLQEATLIKRYKRFLADIQLPNGEIVTIHCPNTGSMKNCAEPGRKVWYSTSDNPKRKYPCTWEHVAVGNAMKDYRAGINTHRANGLVAEAIEAGVIKELQGYDSLKAEVKYGEERSRIDFLLQTGDMRCYVEVKSVTLGMGEGLGAFPDAVTTRGSKHLRELMAQKQQGDRAVLMFCVQHTGISEVRPADEIDPVYGQTLRDAVASGVEIFAYGTKIGAEEIKITEKIPVYW
ncbi:MAG: DNA/RNA nuclease SfsA [Pseudomonadales bacterium]|nr:DNA/RNA nuclease SfsA [Pseudomonadales bacterium]